MDGRRWEKLQNMVLGAKELPDEAQREYLLLASQGDSSLLDQAIQILQAYKSDSSFLSEPVGSVEALMDRKKKGWFSRILNR